MGLLGAPLCWRKAKNYRISRNILCGITCDLFWRMFHMHLRRIFFAAFAWNILYKSFKCVQYQFSSVAQSCLTLCDPMNRSTPGLPIHHQLPESTQTHVHWNGDAIQPSHPLSSPSPPALNLSQHQGLFKWVSTSHQVAKVLEFQFQHQFFQWTPRIDLL